MLRAAQSHPASTRDEARQRLADLVGADVAQVVLARLQLAVEQAEQLPGEPQGRRGAPWALRAGAAVCMRSWPWPLPWCKRPLSWRAIALALLASGIAPASAESLDGENGEQGALLREVSAARAAVRRTRV